MVEVKDYHLVSLVHGMYKIISKVLALANMSSTMVEKVISKPKNAFVKGGIDAVLMENKCLDTRPKSRVLGFLCKVDMKKAYDQVNWSF